VSTSLESQQEIIINKMFRIFCGCLDNLRHARLRQLLVLADPVCATAAHSDSGSARADHGTRVSKISDLD